MTVVSQSDRITDMRRRFDDVEDDTVPKTCVSSKVLIFVVKSRIKQRTMKLTMEQRSDITLKRPAAL